MSSKQPSTSAKILYRPVGLVSSIIGGLLAGVIFKQMRSSRPTRMPTRNQSRPPCVRVSVATAGVPRV
jgi:hypothetical protein